MVPSPMFVAAMVRLLLGRRRRSSTRRRARSSTRWPPGGWRDGGCWYTPRTRAPGASPDGWTTSSPGTGSGWPVMKSDAVAPDKREAWVEDKVKRGIDVLVCHPRLVQTGRTSSTSRPFAGTSPATRSASCGGRDASATPGWLSWFDVLPEHPSSRRVEAGWLRNWEARWPSEETFRRTGWRTSATAGAIC